MGEPEIENFTNFSKSPIQIVLDYRKETIKLIEGSTTIVSIEGDAARKTTFFSGSGLNTGYKALSKLFDFCKEDFIRNTTSCPLLLDQKLLEKDQNCMKISYDLLIKGIYYIDNKHINSPNKTDQVFEPSDSTNPQIYSINPKEGQALGLYI